MELMNGKCVITDHEHVMCMAIRSMKVVITFARLSMIGEYSVGS